MLLLAPAALAFDLREATPVAVPFVATRLVPTPRAGGLYVLVLGDDAVDVLERVGRTTVGSLGRGARDAVQRDADADGVPELWLCDDDGVWRVPWPAADTFEAPVQVLPDACHGFAPFDGGLVVSGSALVQWSDDGAGGLVDGVPIGADLDPVGMASDGETVVAAALGSASVTIVRAAGPEEVPTAGLVGGVAVLDGVPTWSQSDLALVADADGGSVSVAAGPGAIAAADLDGDGDDDLVVSHPDALGVVGVDTGEVTFPVSGWGPIVGVPGTECAAVWALDAAGTSVRIATVADCGADADADGDGYTPAEGDCDDADATTWPGAPVGCDGGDHDCDGVGEWEPGDWLPSAIAVLEGSTVKVVLDPICFDPVTVTWEVPTDPSLDCRTFTRAVWCTGGDDAVASVSADVWDADGTLLDHREAEYTVVNVAPTVDRQGLGPLASATVDLVAGEPFSETIPVDEPGDDTVSFALVSGPDGLTISGDGRIDWTPGTDQLGGSRVEVVLSDEDGGSTTQDYVFQVAEPADTGSLCCSSSAAVFLLLLAPRRRGRTRAGPVETAPSVPPLTTAASPTPTPSARRAAERSGATPPS